jgi:ATP-dependent DNA helicase 2 subunit 2
MGETGIIVAQKHNEQAELALSAFIHALHELESYAVARYVQKDLAQPQILLLKPNPGIEDEFECLYDVPLPFAEDVRSYQFPPLDKVLTVTGSILKEHRLLPSDDLKQAMSDFVDSMDLSNFGEDEEGYVLQSIFLARVDTSAGNRQSMRQLTTRTIQLFTA